MGKRAVEIYVVLILFFTGILCRLYLLTMTNDALASAAHGQSGYLLEVDHTRGIIYDCHLKPLVGTEKQVVAAVQPVPEAYAALTDFFRKNGWEIELDLEADKPFLLPLQQDAVYSKGIETFEISPRYGKNQLAPHIIGYLDPEKENGTAGIELAYNDLLKQYDGDLRLRYTLDAAGQMMQAVQPEIIQDNYRSKGGVALTIDANMQRVVQDAMQGVEKGAAVVMNVNTGDIKASVSMPAYDPNDLAASLKDPDSPFVNRAFSQYNVGSTFKLVTAAAALEAGYGRFVPYTCEGYIDVEGQVFYCHWRNGHGELDLERAIAVSCNPYFIQMGLDVGGERIVSLARQIGFTRAAQFTDELRSQSGTLPSETELKNPAAVANLAFGQGSLTATPIQIAQMLSTVANGGYAVTPRLVEGFTDDGQSMYEHTIAYAPVQVISKSTSDILRAALVNNVENGSGKNAKPIYSTAGGKTASAQTGIYETPGDEDSEIVHAWFAGYFPADVPKYAIAVLVEGGESGGDIAAPIFQKIADGIYLSEL